jgi:single-stranded-DNA-specific exonuclease
MARGTPPAHCDGMTTTPTPLATALVDARARFATFLARVPPTAHVVVFCHYDADGLAAGALFGRALPRLGYGHVDVVPALRGESAFSHEARTRLHALAPGGLIVTDLGVHAHGVLPGVPTCYVDHHRPSGEPTGATVVSGYGWDPIPASAWLAYELLRAVTDVGDLAWLAAAGTISDLGDQAPWDDLAAIRKRYTAKWLKEAVVLVNAARRAGAFDVATPLRMLMEVDGPRAVSEDVALGADRLQAYRAEVNAALAVARREAPRFSATGPYALLWMHSPCQIHPLIAQQWRGRLPKHAVIAANTGYVADGIAFSMRTSRADVSLPVLLQSIDLGALGDYGGRFGHGHDQASGGHLPADAFAALLAQLGFTPDVSRPIPDDRPGS